MMRLRVISGNRRGAAAIEFALIVPALLTFLFGAFQIGVVLFADAGLKSSIGEATRFATLFPTPTDDQIKARISNTKFGVSAGTLAEPTVERGEAGGKRYIDITLTYNYTMEPVILPDIPITLVESRRAYIQAN